MIHFEPFRAVSGYLGLPKVVLKWFELFFGDLVLVQSPFIKPLVVVAAEADAAEAAAAVISRIIINGIPHCDSLLYRYMITYKASQTN